LLKVHAIKGLIRVRGGEAFNIVAPMCTVTWDVRSVPEENVTALVRRIEDRFAKEILAPWQSEHPGVSLVTRQIIDVASLAPDPDGAAESLVRHLTGANVAGTVPFGTEAGIFQRGGVPSAVIGPGAIDQAHKADEFIAESQLKAGEKFLRDLVAWCAWPES